MSNDCIEFYCGAEMIAAVRSSIVPTIKARISIRGKVWIVSRVTYALDYADKTTPERIMRANVDIYPQHDKKDN